VFLSSWKGLIYHNGKFYLYGNAVCNFFTASIGLVRWAFFGKEGPSCSSGAKLWVATWLKKSKIPIWCRKLLLACGVAGAISAVISNTSLAGALFAFEVIFFRVSAAL